MSTFAQTNAAMERLSDERLIVLVGEGDERAFEELADRYREPLLRYCRRLSLTPLAAEDALQQALVDAWTALRRGTRVREPKAWLYRVAHNSAVDLTRRAVRERDRCCEVGSQPEFASEGVLEDMLESRATLAALAGLPVLQREAIVRCAVEGLSHKQAARDLGVSASAVRGLIYRARAALRKALDALIPPPVLAWLTRADVGVGVSGGSAGVGATLLRGAAVTLTVGLLAGAVATHGLRSAPRHARTPLGEKAFAVPPRAAHDARLRPRPTASPHNATRDGSGARGAAGNRAARPGGPAQALRAIRPGASTPTVVKAAHARGATPGVSSLPAATAPAATRHANPTSRAVTGGPAGTDPVSSARGSATATSDQPRPSQGATPVRGAAGTKAANGAQAGVLASSTAHSVGETARAAGEAAHTVGETAAHTVGETVHTVGETAHTVGETVQKVGGALQGGGTTGQTGAAVGEAVHHVTEPVAGAGEIVQKAGGALQNGGTTGQAGAAVGEAVHHVTEPVRGLAETVHSAGGLVGAP
jgi:RNA polymerase sigma factor (sigma-70 family)